MHTSQKIPLWSLAALLLTGLTGCGQDMPVTADQPVATVGGGDALVQATDQDVPANDTAASGTDADAGSVPDTSPDAAEDAAVDAAEDAAPDLGPDGAAETDGAVGTDAVGAVDAADSLPELGVDAAEDSVLEWDADAADEAVPDPDVTAAEDAVPAVDVDATEDAWAGTDVEAAVDALTDAAAVDVLTDVVVDATDVGDAADGVLDASDAGCAPLGCLNPDTPCDATHPCAIGVCNPSSLTCIGCISSADCPGGLCENHTCVAALACQSDITCKAAGLVCDKKLGVCAPCAVTADCLGQGSCIANHCVVVLPCVSSLQCPLGQICDGVSGTCVACAQNVDCAAGQFCNADHVCQAHICSDKLCVAGSLFACQAGGGGYLPSVSCNDGSPCTTDTCELPTGCKHVPIGGVCSDGDACTVADTCGNGICAGTWNSCDDGSVCTTDSCTSDTGCHHVSYLGACNDGSACTQFDSCATGTCAGQPVSCDDGTPCTDDSCNPTTGCVHLPNTATCTDANACTQGDTCQGGQCVASGLTECTDSDPCTADSCQTTSGCLHAPASGPVCDDGSACTANDVCSSGVCGGVPVVCNDNNPCTSDSCPTKSGCSFVPAPGACEDGDPCTVNDTCANGACQAGTAKVCNDGDPCTLDTCVSTVGCKSAPISGPACSDGNACTQGDTCGAQGCQPGSSVSCDDSDKCTADSCVPATGCVHTPAMNPCDDGLSCTLDTCSANTCSHKSLTLGLWTSGGALDDSGVGLAVDPSGGTAILGTTRSNGAGGSDFWLQYLSASGDVVWSVTKGDTGDDTAMAMAPRVGGGYWLAGKTSTGGIGGEDAWLLGVNAQGATIADVKAGTSANDVFAAVASLADGGAVVAGTRGAGSSGLGGTDAWVTRVSAGGSIVWTVPVGLLGGSGNDAATAVTVAANGDILVAWAFDKFATGMAFDAWASRLSSSGAVIWSAGIANSALSETPRAILEAADGSILLAGDVTAADGSSDAWVARLTSAGNLVWEHSYGSSIADSASAIREVHGGFVFVGATAVPATGKTDAWLVRIDGYGNLMCSETYGGAADDRATALQILPDGRIAWVGTTASSGAGGTDVWRALVDSWGHADCQIAGVCASLTLAACDDATSCTVDGCDPVTGCTHAPSPGACSDGNACTQGDTCQGLVCTSGAIAVCNDNDPCTTDVCDPTLGCYHSTAANGTACNDLNACTLNDTCQNRHCQGATPKTCPTVGVCQATYCDQVLGCKVTNQLDGTVCGTYTCGSATCSYHCTGGVCQ